MTLSKQPETRKRQVIFLIMRRRRKRASDFFMMPRNGQGLLQKKDNDHRIFEKNSKKKITGDKEQNRLNNMTRIV